MKREITYEDYAKKLTGEYKKAYDKIYVYVVSALSVGDEIRPAMNEVVDLLLAAQADDKPVERVIGNDMEKFCEGIVESNRKPVAYRTIMYLVIYVFMAIVVGVVYLFAVGIDVASGMGVYSALFVKTDIFSFFSSLFITVTVMSLFDVIVRLFAMKIKGLQQKWYKLIYGIVLIATVVGNIVLVVGTDLELKIPRFYILVFCLVYAVGVSLFSRFYKKKYMTEEDEEPVTTVELSDELHNEIIVILRKKYEKNRKRREKKELPELSPLAWYEKELKKDKIAAICSNLFFVCLIAAAVLQVAQESALWDTLIFVALLLALEIPIIYAGNSGSRKRRELMRIMKEKGIDFMNDELYRKIE